MSRLCPECRYSGGSHRAGCPEDGGGKQCEEHGDYRVDSCPMCAAMDAMLTHDGLRSYYHNDYQEFSDWIGKVIDGDKTVAEARFNQLTQQPYL